MTRRLIPKPHMLKSIRARNWHLAGAIEELVDNSIAHGKASHVVIRIENEEGIYITDNGIGLDNINRIFHYGDASAHDDLKQIGQYGVGAKNATIYLGDHVLVGTTYKGRRHFYSVDWAEVERSQEWPAEYISAGRPAKADEIGTTVLISKLARHYQLATTEKMANDFGIIFAPVLRNGKTTIEISHTLANGKEQSLVVTPFSPDDLTDIVPIYGEIETRHGLLCWSGRVGLSASLVERHNGIHIAFGHRVIESTRDPFKGKSAPTLYAEIQLDDSTAWKHQLSEHKDRVVRYRDELMASIHEAIKELLDKSSRQAQNLALNLMIAPIESALNKAIKAAGDLLIDPEEEPMIGGVHGEGQGGKKKKRTLFTPVTDGITAKEIKRPTGISFDWRTPEQLEGRAYAWELSGSLLIILLDETLFKPILDWPPTAKNDHLQKMVIDFASNAIQMEFINDEQKLKGVIDQKLIGQISNWLGKDGYIAPRLIGLFLRSMKAQGI